MGDLVLDPFTAQVGNASVLTPAARATVIVGEGEREQSHPRLAWDAPPPALGIGKAAELTLRILDNDPRRPLRRLPLHITAPLEALLEEIPLTAEEADQGLALRLRLIPLGGNRVSLGPFPLRFETTTLEAPAISIALAPPPPGAPPLETPPPAPGALPAGPGPLDEPPPVVAPAFPEVPGEPFPLFRGSYRKALDKARDYWQQALYAEALGELRRGERDLLSGPALGPTRRAAEGLLGLPPTADEKWRPRNCFAALIILSLCLLLLTIALSLRFRGKKRASGRFFQGSSRNQPDFRKGSVTSPFFRGYTVVAFVLLGIMGFGIAALAYSPRGFEAPIQGGAGEAGKHPGNAAAVLRSCAAYRVPDIRGAISARWLEGQPVRVRSASDAWAYAESPGGDAGWVTQDNVVYY
jgi:hypothetical protein